MRTEHHSLSLGTNQALIWGRSSLLHPLQYKLGPHWCRHRERSPPGDKWSLPYQIFNTASKGTPPFMLLLSKCQGFRAPRLLLHQTRVSSTAGQHHLVNNSLLQRGVLVCAPPYHLSVRGADRPESPSHRRPFVRPA